MAAKPQSAVKSHSEVSSYPASLRPGCEALRPYQSGVSLHSHTSMSEESLLLAHGALARVPGLGQVFGYYERQSVRCGFTLDYMRGHWRPPFTPRRAYELEAEPIRAMGLRPLVSLTDHDTIAAPQLLRSLASTREIPVSVEWTVPFGATEFHLGIHHLPPASAYSWMTRLAGFTEGSLAEAAARRAGRGGGQGTGGGGGKRETLGTLLAELDELPGVLVILNHPVWDLQRIGAGAHRCELARFLTSYGSCLHALELNGLRDGRENRAVAQVARETGHLLVSGGDRHGAEPSACLNLSRARHFGEFAEEIRVERRSHVLFLPQYQRPWKERILQSTLDAVRHFPEFPEGWQCWDERAFHPDRQGEMRPLRQLWGEGGAPLPLRAAIQLAQLGRSQALSRAWRLGSGGEVDVCAELELF